MYHATTWVIVLPHLELESLVQAFPVRLARDFHDALDLRLCRSKFRDFAIMLWFGSFQVHMY